MLRPKNCLLEIGASNLEGPLYHLCFHPLQNICSLWTKVILVLHTQTLYSTNEVMLAPNTKTSEAAGTYLLFSILFLGTLNKLQPDVGRLFIPEGQTLRRLL